MPLFVLFFLSLSFFLSFFLLLPYEIRSVIFHITLDLVFHLHRELLEQYLIGELPPEEHEVLDTRDELAFPDQKNVLIFAVPVVLGIIAMVAWKYRHLFLES